MPSDSEITADGDPVWIDANFHIVDTYRKDGLEKIAERDLTGGNLDFPICRLFNPERENESVTRKFL